MNNRIKELAEQAREDVANIRVVSGQREMTWFPEAFESRFAELIIEECGEVAYKAYWDNPNTVRGIHIKDKIKQHFGVE